MEPFLDLLRDGVWQFVGAVFALLAMPFAFWIYLFQRQRKEVAFGHLSTRRLLAVAKELEPRISITLDGKPVQRVHMVILALKNSGTVPILRAEFAQPLTFALGPESQLLSVEVASRAPAHLPVALQTRADAVEVDLSLLNPGDYFVLQALVSGSDPEFKPIVRIAGVVELAMLRGGHARFGAGYRWHEFLIPGLALAGVLYYVVAESGVSAATQWLVLSMLGVFVFSIALRWLRSRYGAEAARYIDDA